MEDTEYRVRILAEKMRSEQEFGLCDESFQGHQL